MNIFYVDSDPEIAAKQLNDKHVVKMTLELAQILCSVSWRHGVEAPYRQTHKKHPAVLWAGETRGNWDWALRHGLALAKEYTIRYQKVHKSEAIMMWCLEEGGKPGFGDMSLPRQCMPDEYHDTDPIKAYQRYYLKEKMGFSTWREPGMPPSWVLEAFGDQIQAWRNVDDEGNEYGPVIRGLK